MAKELTKKGKGEIILIIGIVLGIIFLIVGISKQNKKMENLCREGCGKYNMEFLRSERASHMGYNCFCLDDDDKPRQIPSMIVKEVKTLKEQREYIG